jgi:PAS domain-containing protein
MPFGFAHERIKERRPIMKRTSPGSPQRAKRPRAAEAVQTIDAGFSGFLDAAPDAMVIVGRDGRIQLLNGQAERLFGYDRAELLGQPVEILVPARYRQRHPDVRGRFSRSRARGQWGPASSCMRCAKTAPSFQPKSASAP